MNSEKTMILALMDLCAFACSQDDSPENRADFEIACILGDDFGIPETKAYRDIIHRLSRRDSPMPESRPAADVFSPAPREASL
jgi:hypothetical protein